MDRHYFRIGCFGFLKHLFCLLQAHFETFKTVLINFKNSSQALLIREGMLFRVGEIDQKLYRFKAFVGKGRRRGFESAQTGEFSAKRCVVFGR